MSLRRSITFVVGAALAPLVALGVAACGDTTATPMSAPPTTTGGAPAAVGVASNGSLGNILVDSQGRTLYLFAADNGTTSTCTGACAVAWPPVTASGTATVGNGANAALVGTSPSPNTGQITYNGHPLYLFARDTKPGDTSGQGLTAFGGAWYVVSPSGNQITGSGSSGGSTTGGGGLGY
jgi:predicted lipoprotein with Yx(FWY)xxD motif